MNFLTSDFGHTLNAVKGRTRTTTHKSKTLLTMPNENPKHSADEMTPALRKALVESGALIPTTPAEVELAEAHLTRHVTAQEVDAAFAQLQKALNDTSPDPAFMQLDESVIPPADSGLAMAARNGDKLDAETLAKIEESVARATRKPPQT